MAFLIDFFSEYCLVTETDAFLLLQFKNANSVRLQVTDAFVCCHRSVTASCLTGIRERAFSADRIRRAASELVVAGGTAQRSWKNALSGARNTLASSSRRTGGMRISPRS